ncbi:uncharacterized protein ARMOST_21812 [Armillaria ostoyae]|uniref:Uncharacterized protein n=1 Tax=Armillaria ostoyae TaxID=47428 RepID=A0A284SB42_ARMOS|nr:uncharacterized protein ARMOST_21812 [Armillaria ostoyae]
MAFSRRSSAAATVFSKIQYSWTPSTLLHNYQVTVPSPPPPIPSIPPVSPTTMATDIFSTSSTPATMTTPLEGSTRSVYTITMPVVSAGLPPSFPNTILLASNGDHDFPGV